MRVWVVSGLNVLLKPATVNATILAVYCSGYKHVLWNQTVGVQISGVVLPITCVTSVHLTALSFPHLQSGGYKIFIESECRFNNICEIFL